MHHRYLHHHFLLLPLKSIFQLRVLFRTLKLIKYVEPWQRVSQSIVGYRGQWRCKHCCSRNSALAALTLSATLLSQLTRTLPSSSDV